MKNFDFGWGFGDLFVCGFSGGVILCLFVVVVVLVGFGVGVVGRCGDGGSVCLVVVLVEVRIGDYS